MEGVALNGQEDFNTSQIYSFGSIHILSGEYFQNNQLPPKIKQIYLGSVNMPSCKEKLCSYVQNCV